MASIVRGAQKWVGRARWNYGSFYLWGDVPALMPPVRAYKSSGMNWSDPTKRGQDFTRIAGEQAIKNNGGLWFAVGSPGQRVVGKNPVHELAGIKAGNASERRWEDRPVKRLRDAMKGDGGSWFGENDSAMRQGSSKSPRRKFASAMIAKIPLPLSRHIAATFYPK